MIFSDFSGRTSIIHLIDPRVRIASCFVFSCTVSALNKFPLLGTVFLMSYLLLFISRIRLKEISGRLFALNIFFIFFFLTLPFSPVPQGGNTISLWGISMSHTYLQNCCRAVLRGNTILFLCTSLINTVDIVTFAQALSSMRLPPKLVYLMMFTVRYLDLIHCEYLQVKKSIAARAFVPRMNIHTYRTAAYLAAAVAVKALDRSERVSAAMKCRCFSGKFHTINDFSISGKDIVFASVFLMTAGGLLLGDLF